MAANETLDLFDYRVVVQTKDTQGKETGCVEIDLYEARDQIWEISADYRKNNPAKPKDEVILVREIVKPYQQWLLSTYQITTTYGQCSQLIERVIKIYDEVVKKNSGKDSGSAASTDSPTIPSASVLEE